MTRVSLKEAYDNKDVVAQIYAIRDIAEGAEDTANNAVSTANTASEHVDALVPQVEGAVQNANNASASAQASAQTVAGYENRVTALETADGQNVKLSGDQNISGIKTVPTEATGTRSQQIANSAKVGQELDNYAPMLRLTGNASVYGRKAFNAISMRNVNGQGSSTSSLEFFRFKPTSGQDHRFNFFRHLGYGVCLTSLRVQTNDATVTAIDGSKTPIGTSTGNITIGAGFTTDGWCVVFEKNESACVFCLLLSAFTGSRFPIKEANIDMSNQCNVVDPTSLSGKSEVTL